MKTVLEEFQELLQAAQDVIDAAREYANFGLRDPGEKQIASRQRLREALQALDRRNAS